MTHYTALFQQLPRSIQNEISAHVGSTAGMSELQIIEKYRGTAMQIKAAKVASIPPDAQGYPGHLTVDEFNNMSGADLTWVSAPLVEVRRQLLASEGVWYLDNMNQLSSIHAQMTEAAREHAQRQAEAAAQAFILQRAQEAAARDGPGENQPPRHLLFMPGPAAAAEIERATLALKYRIDAAVIDYASSISPYLHKQRTPASPAS